MTTAYAITTLLNLTVLQTAEGGYRLWQLLGLTPTERWQGARRFNGGFIVEHWFILTALAVLLVLGAWLVVVSYNRAIKHHKAVEQAFIERSQRRGLTERERKILLNMARYARIRRPDGIFTMPAAFDEGAVKIIEQGLGGGLTAAQGAQLKAQLSALREKIGYKKQSGPSVETTTKSKRIEDTQTKSREHFQQIALNRPALVAQFPIAKTVAGEGGNDHKAINDLSQGSGSIQPAFVSGTLTEVSGASVRVEAPLKVEEGDRVLVILGLAETNSSGERRQQAKTELKILEDVGEVKQIKAIGEGLSMEIELTGLDDMELGRLIEQTNGVSAELDAENQVAAELGETVSVATESSSAQGI
jgi:hypothetical protein